MAVDYVYRLEQPHVSGQLALVCQTIADAGGLIGDLVTIQVGRDRSIREISIEVRDPAQAEEVAARLERLDGVRVISYYHRAMRAHEGGKLAVEVRQPVTTRQQARDVYTPGVARVCTAIAADPALANRFTMIGRTVAICTNGTRVLGLGNIGPVASMPVMEGKALFYRQMAGISAMPILIDSDDVDTFVDTVVRVAPGFGAIHLEDIRVPDCFEIEARLIDKLDIPVMHDDAHGTAVVTLAAALAAGAAFAVDGTSVNNVLGFPGIFRGALLAGAREISTGMKLAAAHAIARLSQSAELVPDVLDPQVHATVAQAVLDAAQAEGLARPERVPTGL